MKSTTDTDRLQLEDQLADQGRCRDVLIKRNFFKSGRNPSAGQTAGALQYIGRALGGAAEV